MSKNGNNTEGEKLLFCSFCGKNQNEVRKLIAGPSVYICNECIDLCNDIILEEITHYICAFVRKKAEILIKDHFFPKYVFIEVIIL